MYRDESEKHLDDGQCASVSHNFRYGLSAQPPLQRRGDEYQCLGVFRLLKVE